MSMKKICHRYINRAFNLLKYATTAGLSLVLIGAVTSCSKDDADLGAPEITGLRAITPAPADSMLTFVLPGQNVVIQGRNFGGLRAVYFDGVAADFNGALNTDHSIVLSVPTGIIFPSVQPEDMNKIKVVTLSGSTIYDFAVSPPPPVINSISNELAAPGTQITIKGAYLFTISQLIFPGNKVVSDGFQPTLDGSTLTVNVPAGVTGISATDSIQINTVGGATKAAFHNNYGVVANFEDGDPDFGWQWWGGIKSNDATAFPDGWGNYIEIKPQNTINPGDGSWYGDNRAVMIDAHAPWPGVDITKTPDNYAIKFEMNVKDSWKDGALTIAINGDFDHLARLAFWETTPGYTTNGWQTITVPLSAFLASNEGAYDAGGSPAATVSTLTGGAKDATIQIMLINDGTTVLSPFDAAFDNVRVVKIKD